MNQHAILIETLVCVSIEALSKKSFSTLRISSLLFCQISFNSLPILNEKLDLEFISSLAKRDLIEGDLKSSWNGTWKDFILVALFRFAFATKIDIPIDIQHHLVYSAIRLSPTLPVSKWTLCVCLRGIASHTTMRDYYVQVLYHLCSIEINLQSVAVELNIMNLSVQFQDILNALGIKEFKEIVIPNELKSSPSIELWLKSYLWGTIYQRNQNGGDVEYSKVCPPIWAGTYPKLFKIHI